MKVKYKLPQELCTDIFVKKKKKKPETLDLEGILLLKLYYDTER